jgi:DnaJ domain
VSVPNFYQLLSLPSTASAEEIKRAFRTEIARYHPDKVQHLGKEFQDMAATRAAQLTEAYRTLMNAELRSEYDRLHVGTAGTAVPPPDLQGAPDPQAPSSPSAREPAPAPHTADDPGAPRPARFAQEHATRDEFVRKATLARLRKVLAVEFASVSEVSTAGFDFDCSAKSKKLFGRGGSQRFAVRFVPRVDRTAIQELWAMAQKVGGSVCLLLMGNGLAPARELADAIDAMRRRSRGQAGICLVPIDMRDWTTHIPADAPPECKAVIQKLRNSTA